MRLRHRITCVLGSMLVLLPSAVSSPTSFTQAPIAIIVAKNETDRHLDQSELKRIYLRQITLWKNRDPIVPINLDVSHPLRRLFSERLLQLDPEALESYWNDEYFHGVLPPFVLASEEAVLRFVAETPQAIGYVSACAVDRRVRVLGYLTSKGLALRGEPAGHCPQR